MAKYIDAEHLRKEVKGLERAAHKSALGCADSETRKFHEGKDFAYQHVGILIDSLQHEQPEVDLEKEIGTYFQGWTNSDDYYQALNAEGECVSTDEIIEIARHFYELGKLKARK